MFWRTIGIALIVGGLFAIVSGMAAAIFG